MTRRTGFVFDERFLWHATGDAAGYVPAGPEVEPWEHVESAASKRRIVSLLRVSGVMDELTQIRCEPVDDAYLLQCHDRAHIDATRLLSETGGDAGESTPMGRGSFEIALLAAGGVRSAFDAVLRGEVDNAYALVRPPGHHAERDRARGFCLFGNAALGVMHAINTHGVKRVAVVDWDVHHGNGTQQAFYDRCDVLTISLHQDNLYPAASGLLAERGIGSGANANINVPLPAGCGSGAYAAAFERIVLPALARFRPELIVVASGFDAAAHDPMGRMMLHSDSYREMTLRLLGAADEYCGGRLVMTHEGGYSPFYSPYCGLAVLEALSGRRGKIADPFLRIVSSWGGHDVTEHQLAAIAAAEPFVATVPKP